MRGVNKCAAMILFLAAVLAVGTGCPPSAPNITVAMIVSPTSLDFGTTLTQLSFRVAKNFTAKPLPTFSVTADKNWISANPSSGTSTGPTDLVIVTITINRALLVAGTNTATVTVASPGVVPKTILVTAATAIVANFTAAPTTITPGQSVSFTDTSTVTGGTINAWAWTFGDGGQSSAQNPTHQYNTLGDYTVTLQASSGALSDTAVKTNLIHVIAPQPPVANFSAATTTPLDDTNVLFTDLSTPGTSPISDWFWNFGDGGTSVAQNPIHVYHSVAQYSVYLLVTTLVGSDDELKVNYINVQPKLPTANFFANNTTPKVNSDNVQFSDQSDPGSGPILQWWWHFGDHVTSTAQNPTHIYTAVKVYSVYLNVLTQYGQSTKIITNYIHVQN